MRQRVTIQARKIHYILYVCVHIKEKNAVAINDDGKEENYNYNYDNDNK